MIFGLTHSLYISAQLHNENGSLMLSKICVKRPLSKRSKISFQDQLLLNAGQKYCRMLQGEHPAIFLTFIKLPFVSKIFVLSIFEWPFYCRFYFHTLWMRGANTLGRLCGFACLSESSLPLFVGPYLFLISQLTLCMLGTFSGIFFADF